MDNVVVAYENREVVKLQDRPFPLKAFKQLVGIYNVLFGDGLGVRGKVMVLT